MSTSGARAVEAFTVDGLELLAVPQLAVDAPGTPAGMNGGDSNTDLVLFRRAGGKYERWSSLAAPGGEDAEFFTIADRSFLAVANIRTGSGPYDYEVDSRIYEWHEGTFLPLQAVSSFAAKQWKHWRIAGRHFLGLAQGAALPGQDERNRASIVYEWDGSAFVEFQPIPSRWAYNWHAFEIGAETYVAHAEHLDASVLYRWDGRRLVAHQELAERSGRAFETFARAGEHYLLVGCLQAPSWLMRWIGGRFEPVQRLDNLGAREFAAFGYGDRLFVVRVNFVLGTPAEPQPSLMSQLYEFRAGHLEIVAEFPTTGATDVAVLERGDGVEIIVSNSLSPEVTFASGVDVYRLVVD
jgi:hypothetical protein